MPGVPGMQQIGLAYRRGYRSKAATVHVEREVDNVVSVPVDQSDELAIFEDTSTVVAVLSGDPPVLSVLHTCVLASDMCRLSLFGGLDIDKCLWGAEMDILPGMGITPTPPALKKASPRKRKSQEGGASSPKKARCKYCDSPIINSVVKGCSSCHFEDFQPSQCAAVD